LPGTERFVLGEGGGLTEVRYVGTGFLHTRWEVYEKIAEHEKLPDGNHWYLGEDFAFAERARRCGFDVYVDTSFRLEHIGTYGCTWEDAGTDKPRYASYNYYFK
jgi:hypothetical protein